MPDDSQPTGSPPPLVLKVEEYQSPPLPRQPSGPLRSGLLTLLECIIWCLVFLGTQLFATLLVALPILTIYALQAPDPTRYLLDQLRALDVSTPEHPEADGLSTEDISRSLAIGMLSAQLASLGLILFVFPRRIGGDWTRQLAVRRPTASQVILVLLIVPGFMILSGGIEEVLRKVTGLRPLGTGREIKVLFGSFPWYLTFLALGAGPGLMEELWCRGLIGRRLSTRFGLPASIAITSAFFGMLHVDPAYALITATMGVFLHFIYLATRSIWASVLLHTANNSLSVLATLTGALDQLEPEVQAIAIPLYLTSLALVGFGGMTLWRGRPRLVLREPSANALPEWKAEYPDISIPPANSGVILELRMPNPATLVMTIILFGILVILLVG